VAVTKNSNIITISRKTGIINSPIQCLRGAHKIQSPIWSISATFVMESYTLNRL
jgi:hypothetical protein